MLDVFDSKKWGIHSVRLSPKPPLTILCAKYKISTFIKRNFKRFRIKYYQISTELFASETPCKGALNKRQTENAYKSNIRWQAEVLG